MPNTTASQGPGRGALSVVQRIFTLLLSIAQTRLELAAVELEEEKSHLVQLLIMAGLTLLFAGFCLMGLFILVCTGNRPRLSGCNAYCHYRHAVLPSHRRWLLDAV